MQQGNFIDVFLARHGRMYPKHVELKIHQQNYLVASSWHFKLFHEEDAWSNNPQVSLALLLPVYSYSI
jgi:hypothetical protein